MYEEYFRFSGPPFKLNPDPRFFFGSRTHNKAMAYLHYGLRQAEGFIVITGEIGAGKSMLISHLLDQLDRSRITAAHLLTPNLQAGDLLSHVLSAFRVVPSGEGRTANIEAFEDFLFDQLNHGKRVLLIIDEAQNLPVPTLEELRVLSNMDYDGTPLFQVFLVGQPDFRPLLAAPSMEQLRQRIIASYHLEPLSLDETKNYIEHRMSVVGWTSDPAFSEGAFQRIHRETDGVPRKVNKLCNRILLYCSLEERHEVNADVVAAVAADLAAENVARPTSDDDQKIRPARVPSAGARALPGEAREREPAGAPRFDAPAGEGGPTPSDDRALAGSAGPAGGEHAPSTDATAGPPRAESGRADDEIQEDGPVSEETEMTEESVGVSVLDRLQRARGMERARPRVDAAPAPATINDVADAIAAALPGTAGRAAAGQAPAPGAAAEPAPAEDLEPELRAEGELDAPRFDEDAKGWRQSVIRSINETRDELKSAHSNLTQVRRSLSEADRRRRDRQAKISASLSRAESLLAAVREG